MDQLPRLGKRELICLLLFTCNYVVFVWRSFLFLWVLGMDYVILLWHSLSLPYNYSVTYKQVIVMPFQKVYVWFAQLNRFKPNSQGNYYLTVPRLLNIVPKQKFPPVTSP